MIKFEVEELYSDFTFEDKVTRFTRIGIQIKFFGYRYVNIVDVNGHDLLKIEIRKYKRMLISQFIRTQILWT